MSDNAIPAYPKIWHIGTPEMENLFTGEVEVTEKIDGSQFAFGKLEDGTLVMRSKGKQVYPETVEKLFKKTVDHILSVQESIPNGFIFYGESVTSPRHNTLSYAKTPLGYFVLFGIKDSKGLFITSYSALKYTSILLGVQAVPLLFKGKIQERSQLDVMLNLDSVLGNEKIEGVVIKNYEQLANSAFSRECFAKLVRPGFKERNSSEHPSKRDKMEDFLSQFKTDARWNKAIQHLRDSGELTQSPKDIGKIILEIHKDLKIEEREYIKNALYNMYERQILSASVLGFPEFYKQHLLDSQFSVQAAPGI